MLKQRLITGLILAIIAITVLFFLPLIWFQWFTGLVMLGAAWEWTGLAEITSTMIRWIYLLLIALGLYISQHYLPLQPVLIVTELFWIMALYWIIQYPQKKAAWQSVSVRLLLGFIVLIPCWLAINFIRAGAQGEQVLFLMFLLVWSADIGAYFVGRQWGRHKLMPAVSPNKSWEGALGGLVLSSIVALISQHYFAITFNNEVVLMIALAVFNIASITGDLFESLLKRHANLKDSGRILPGHGGLLDRLDSLTAVAPLFALGLILNFYS